MHMLKVLFKGRVHFLMERLAPGRSEVAFVWMPAPVARLFSIMIPSGCLCVQLHASRLLPAHGCSFVFRFASCSMLAAHQWMQLCAPCLLPCSWIQLCALRLLPHPLRFPRVWGDCCSRPKAHEHRLPWERNQAKRKAANMEHKRNKRNALIPLSSSYNPPVRAIYTCP
jgi:hypothetical protein